MKKLKRLSVLLMILLASAFGANEAKADRHLASEFLWEDLGNDSFLIKLQVYYRCKKDTTYPVPKIEKKSKCGKKIYTPVASFKRTDVTPLCPSVCSSCKGGTSCSSFGVIMKEYQLIVDLSTERKNGCCWVSFFTYGSQRLDYGYTHINSSSYINKMRLNVCNSQGNKSPIFKKSPIYINYEKSNVLTDYEKEVDTFGLNYKTEEIVYSIDTIFINKTQSISYKNYKFSHLKPLEYTGHPKRYKSIEDIPNGFVLDEETGQFFFRAIDSSFFLYSLRMDEYRNGKHIGTTRRLYSNQLLNLPKFMEIGVSLNNIKSNNEHNWEINPFGQNSLNVNAWFLTNKISLDSLKIALTGLPDEVKIGNFYKNDNGRLHFVLNISKANTSKLFQKDTTYLGFLKLNVGSCPIPFESNFVLRLSKIPAGKFGRLSKRLIDKDCESYDYKGPKSYKYDWYVNGVFAKEGYGFNVSPNYDDTLVITAIRGTDIYSDTLFSQNKKKQIFDFDLPTEVCLNDSFTITPKLLDTSLRFSSRKWIWKGKTSTNESFSSILKKNEPTQNSVVYRPSVVGGCDYTYFIPIIARTTVSLAPMALDTCVSDSFRVPLEVLQKGGIWQGNGVRNDTFRSQLTNEGMHLIRYHHFKDGLCFSKKFNINFTEPVDVKLDTAVIKTCVQHVEIPLPQPLKNIVWTGKGVVNDYYFQYPKDTSVYLKATKTTVAGCTDSDSMLIVVSGTLKSRTVVPSDTAVCGNSPKVKMNFLNYEKVKFNFNKSLIQYTPDSTFFISRYFPERVNYVIAKGEDSNYCYTVDTVEFTRHPSLRIQIRPHVPNFVCAGDTLVELISFPTADYWKGKNKVEIGGRAYFDPSLAKIGNTSYFNAFIEDTFGCLNSASQSILVKDTLNSAFRIHDTLCQGKRVIQIPDLKRFSGNWTHQGIGKLFGDHKNSPVFRVELKKSDFGTFTITHVMHGVNTGTSCHVIPPFTYYIEEFNYLKPVLDTNICISNSPIKLVARPRPTYWAGDGVYQSGGEYYFDPKASKAGVNKLMAVKEGKYVCVDTMFKNINVKDTLLQHYQLNTKLCQGENELIIPNLRDIKGEWTLNGTGKLEKQKDGDYLYTSSSSDIGKAQITRQLNINQSLQNCIETEDLEIEIQAFDPIKRLSADSVHCDDGTRVPLSSVPKSVIWTGDGVTESGGLYYFNPVQAKAGEHAIKAVLTDPSTSCRDSGSLQMLVKESIFSPYHIYDTICRQEGLHYLPTDKRIKGRWNKTGSGSLMYSGDSLFYYRSADDQGDILLTREQDNTMSQFCVNEDDIRISIKEGPEIRTTDTISLCPDSDLQLLEAQPGQMTWTGKGVEEIDGKYYYNVKANGGKYTIIKANALDKHLCQSRKDVVMERYNRPQIAHSMKDTSICLGDELIKIAMRSKDGYWKADNLDSASQVFSIDPATEVGTYTLEYKLIDDLNCANSDAIRVHIGQAVEAQFTTDKDSGFAPLAVQLDAQTSTGKTAHWTFNQNHTIEDEWTPSYIFDPVGEYIVRLIVEDSLGGCSDTMYKNFVAYGGVGIDAPQGLLAIYPNPTQDQLHIEFSSPDFNNYSIYTSAGQKIRDGRIENRTKVHLNVSDLPDGTYIIHLSGDKAQVQRQFIKY